MSKQYHNPGPIKFTATIMRNTEVNNSGAWIEFPYDLKDTFGVGNLVPFKATFDGRVSYQGSIAKMGGDKGLVLLRKDVRAKLGKVPGESVDVVIELDDKPRELEISQEIKDLLTKEGLQETFDRLSFTQRKEHVNAISEAKRPETREKRVSQLLELLHQKAENHSHNQ